MPREAPASRDASPRTRVVPLAAERISVRRQPVETGRVRLVKRVRSRRVVVDEPLRRDRISVERVPVGRFVETAPGPRWEGDTLVVPVLEEVVVVTRRLRVVEELRVRRHTETTRRPQAVDLRREDMEIIRRGPRGGPGGVSDGQDSRGNVRVQRRGRAGG